MAIRDIDTAFRVTNSNGNFTVTLGDLFAEEKKDLLVKLQVRLPDASRTLQTFAETVFAIAIRLHSYRQCYLQTHIIVCSYSVLHVSRV